MKWNPRYVAYAHYNGNTPDRQHTADQEEWPGGINTGFMLWIQEHARVFDAEHGPRATLCYPEEFTSYLQEIQERE